MYQMFRNQFLSFSMYQSKCCPRSWDGGAGTVAGLGSEPARLALRHVETRLLPLTALASPGFSLGLFPPPWHWEGHLGARLMLGLRADARAPADRSHALLAGFVQFLQYYYQSGCLYRLRALGERHNMDLTVGKDLPLLVVPAQLDVPLLLLQGPWLLAASLPALHCCSANWELWFLLKATVTVIFAWRGWFDCSLSVAEMVKATSKAKALRAASCRLMPVSSCSPGATSPWLALSGCGSWRPSFF